MGREGGVRMRSSNAKKSDVEHFAAIFVINLLVCEVGDGVP